jgi:hypothetical protein
MHVRVAFVALGLLALGTSRAQADTDTPQPQAPSPKRELPDYDGRGQPTSSGNPALWVPRVLLSPVYLVTEYGLRRPLGAGLPAAEHADLPRKLYDFFTFDHHNGGFLPIGFAEFNFNPSVGIYTWWNDAGFKGDNLRLHAEAWPTGWVGVSLIQQVVIDKAHALQIHVTENHRPDQVYYGVGPTSLQSSQSRYGIQKVEAGGAYDLRFWRSSHIETSLGVRNVDTYDGHYENDPSLTKEAATGAFAVPYGFDQDYTAVYDGLVAVLDSRVPAPRTGSGVRLEMDAEQGSETLSAPAASSWLRYGATAAGFVDVTGRSRVLGISVTTIFVDPLGKEPVPFPELVYFGGDHPMVGYYKGRMVDRSAAAATASYAWPIGPWLDGRLEFAVGNVFGVHLSELEPRLFRMSGALGIETAGIKDLMTGLTDVPLELLVGVGTETFAQGATVDSVRVMFGVPHTF